MKSNNNPSNLIKTKTNNLSKLIKLSIQSEYKWCQDQITEIHFYCRIAKYHPVQNAAYDSKNCITQSTSIHFTT